MKVFVRNHILESVSYDPCARVHSAQATFNGISIAALREQFSSNNFPFCNRLNIAHNKLHSSYCNSFPRASRLALSRIQTSIRLIVIFLLESKLKHRTRSVIMSLMTSWSHLISFIANFLSGKVPLHFVVKSQFPVWRTFESKKLHRHETEIKAKVTSISGLF